MKKIFVLLFVIFLLGAWTKNNVFNGGRPLVAEMTGGTAGDAFGSGMAKFWLNQGQGTIEYEVTAEGLTDIFASHIHLVATNAIVVPLEAPVDGSSAGVVSVDPEIIKTIRKNPENYYVNVHTAAFRSGAIAGVLSK